MAIFTNEICGPVASVAVFDEIEEASRRVNASPYGPQLPVAIHSADSVRAYEWASQVHSGMVQVNDQNGNNEFQAPFGGMGVAADALLTHIPEFH
ncbi:Benzaldehyde dehydrogenase [NAD(+)] [compost metagenome]